MLVLVLVLVVIVIVCVEVRGARKLLGSDSQTGATGRRECYPRVSSSWDLIVATQVGRGRTSRGLEMGPGKLTASAGGPGGESRGGPVSFFSGKGGQSVAQAVTDESCSCPWLPSSRAVKPGLAFCWTQWPSQSYVEKSDGAHVLRDDGISLHWGALIGQDERHRRNTIRQSSGALSIQASKLVTSTYTLPQQCGVDGLYGFGLGLKGASQCVALEKDMALLGNLMIDLSVSRHRPIFYRIVIPFSASPKG